MGPSTNIPSRPFPSLSLPCLLPPSPLNRLSLANILVAIERTVTSLLVANMLLEMLRNTRKCKQNYRKDKLADMELHQRERRKQNLDSTAVFEVAGYSGNAGHDALSYHVQRDDV